MNHKLALPVSDGLVLVGCSKEKSATRRALAAFDLYDGGCIPPMRARLGYWPHRDRVRFLSAEHGLVHAETPLHTYDRPLDPHRAVELRPRVAAALTAEFDAAGVPDEILVVAEPLYLVLLADLLAHPARPRIHWIPDHASGWPDAARVLDTWGW
ncbi:hypothetical protein O7623_00250 [Solwaraspora sp. WMMD791]|uniref:DUF6884 domain-containing protein n=1 Tax=Solwaraspora sp. WMMD791 TaxID=3016086 RepID=UPI00249A32CA|nr:DUF6884 domain-containing protein [Solwaraspora sp. WMMD791]WFE27689.1 hypothetical protein O7623_00250 [Solwaraspora sp. WMMD791]